MADSVVNDNKNRGGADQHTYEEIQWLAFWIERVAGFLVVFCGVPRDVWLFLLPVMGFLIITNFLYFLSYINAQVASGNKSQGGGELTKVEDVAFWMERLAVFFVFIWWVPSHEFYRWSVWSLILFSNYLYISCYLHPEEILKESKERVKAKDEMKNMVEENIQQHQKIELDFSLKGSEEEVNDKDERINIIDEENCAQQRAKHGFRLKESMQEEKAQDERNKTDEETTGQHKAKLEVSVKESKKELTRSNEEFQSMEAKYLAKMEKTEDLLKKNYEEERSQLMYELGVTRASVEIYKELLHDLHYHQPE